jgi:oligopeptide/dipeptide ABC transporter ATP-binding protein
MTEGVDTIDPNEPLLRVSDLTVDFPTDDGVVHAVRDLSFELKPREVLGVVGESGSGKSVSSMAILGLLPKSARVSGSIAYRGQELNGLSYNEMRKFRGNSVSMIFQDPMTSLNPVFTVGAQLTEAYLEHHKVSKKAAWAKAVEALEQVGIPQPDRRAKQYPHEFSGGMRQRVVIAMAIINDPDVIIADEPTTALDVTVQAQILELIKELRDELDSAVILITHDLGVVAETCDQVVVMYGGQAVEKGPVDELFAQPEMPYTWGLLGSMPRMDRARQERLTPIPGSPPSLINVPTGCVFNPRCRFSDHVPGRRCFTEHPDLLPTTGTTHEITRHEVRCHIPPEERQQILLTEIRPTL